MFVETAIATLFVSGWLWLWHRAEHRYRQRKQAAAIRVRTIYMVRGWMYCNAWPAKIPYTAIFPAASRLDAARQYGEHVRTLGYWVGRIESVFRHGITVGDS